MPNTKITPSLRESRSAKIVQGQGEVLLGDDLGHDELPCGLCVSFSLLLSNTVHRAPRPFEPPSIVEARGLEAQQSKTEGVLKTSYHDR
jgi:hypothetical protein